MVNFKTASIGQKFTQKDVGETDFSIQDFDFTISEKKLENGKFIVNFNYKTLNGNYELIRNSDTASVHLSFYNSCRSTGATKNQCAAILKDSLIVDIVKSKSSAVSVLNEYKIKDYSAELKASDIVITKEEIN